MRKAVFLLLFFSCNFVQQELQTPREYRVRAPSLPEGWLAQNNLHLQGWLWLIDYVSSDYQNNNFSVKRERRRSNAISINLRKQASAVVLVYPIFAESNKREFLWRPAGADILWQERSGDLGTHSVKATWRAGFRSFVLHKLLEGNFDIRYFNSQKFQYYLDLRIAAPYWDSDVAYLIAEIGNLEMDWYDIRKRPVITLLPNQITSGKWQALNVLQTAWRCEANCTPKLALGRHYFLELDRMQLWEWEVLANGEMLSALVPP